jgi:UDP-2,3-diacylglucosamine pyrophosphatase LpxH
MLAIISDLHLTDGTTGILFPPAAVDVLCDRLCDLAWRASWRADGTYRPIERIDLVLLGDILDLISSRRWLQMPCRPWDDPHLAAVSDTVGGIVDEILRRNVDAIRTLRGLATEGTVSLPPATASGQPVLEAEELPVAVCIHYMVGNRDWPLHLGGTAYDLIRHKVTHHLGLVTPYNRPFPHAADECPELFDTLRRHRVLARHGDLYDPLSYALDRDSASVSDVLAIELVARFVQHAEGELGDQLNPATRMALAELEQVRPMLLAGSYLDGALQRTASPALRGRIKRMWDYMVDQVLCLDALRRLGGIDSGELTDALAAALKIGRRDGQGWIRRTLEFLERLQGTQGLSLVPHALAEADFRNRRARHIVYGHTHHPEMVPLDASHADGFVLSQTYFNAGSWRRRYQPTQMLMGQPELAVSDSFSLLCFYQGDERGGRTYETWTGTLGPAIPMSEMPATSSSAAPGASILRAPQFASRSAAARSMP